MERKALVGKIAAILSYLLLVDAAVETLLSRSPLWWVLVPLLAAYLVISAILWRRTGRAPALIVSLAVLLGLLAVTAWLPDGATRGIVFLGLSTSTVLIVITAVAVLIAGIRLAREPSTPRPLRWIVGALAAYSLFAFLFGVIAGVAYPDMFHAARWRLGVGDRGFSLGLPGWLQGAFIGAFVLLPAALVVQGLRSFFAKRPAPGGPRRLRLTQAGVEAIALCLSLFMALGALRAPVIGRVSPVTALPSKEITRGLEASVNDLMSAVRAANPSTLPPGEQIAAQLEKALPELEARANAIPRDSFNVQAVVDKVGRDPVALFNWVRDQTRLLPYRGVLKGPVGVLMDRGGNSLDRALLLNALLRAAGVQTQLARATLPQEQARRVVERATQPYPQLPAPQPIAIPEDLIESLARSSGMRQADVKEHLERVTAEQRRASELTKIRIREQTQAIADAVGRPRVQDVQAETAALLETLQDHWWLQWMKEGAWVDFDPTLADAAVGSMLVTPQETYQAERLPEDLFHAVTIRVVIEQWADGRLAEQPVLTYTFRVADLHASQLSLSHRPINFPSLEILRESDALERFKNAVLAIRGWLPVLTVGNQETSQSGFTDQGEVKAKGALIGGPGAQTGERVRDMLTGPRGGAPPTSAPKTQQGQLTAEWVDYEVRVPGQSTATIRRQVFDAIGPAARSQGRSSLMLTDAQRLGRGLSLFGSTFVLPQASWIPSTFFHHLRARHWLQHKDLLVQQLRSAGGDPHDLTRQTGNLKPLAVPLYWLAIARQGWSTVRPHVYMSRANILSYTSGRLRMSATGALSLAEEFDVIANDLSVRPGSTGDKFLVRMEQGVSDTVAEGVLLAGFGAVKNVSEAFAASKAQGVDWAVIRSTEDAAWRALRFTADVRARIERDLKLGYTVVTPPAPILIAGQPVTGWWRVNHRTGHTLGISETGAGQASTEMWIVISTAAIAATICVVLASLEPCAPGLTRGEAAICLVAGLVAGLLAMFLVPTFLSEAAIASSLSVEIEFFVGYATVAEAISAATWQAWFFGVTAAGIAGTSGALVSTEGRSLRDPCPSGPSSGPSPSPTGSSGPQPSPGRCRGVGGGAVRIEHCPP